MRGLQGIFLNPFIELFITFFLVIFAADMLGLLVSCVVKNETQAMTAVPFVLILQFVMSGTIFQLQGAASFISNITISKWGVNAICSIFNVNLMNRFIGLPHNPDYLFEAGHLSRLWFILIVFSFMYGAVGAIILKLTIDRDKR